MHSTIQQTVLHGTHVRRIPAVFQLNERPADSDRIQASASSTGISPPSERFHHSLQAPLDLKLTKTNCESNMLKICVHADTPRDVQIEHNSLNMENK
jgi:hypothetical protein